MIYIPFREFWNLFNETNLGTEEFRMLFPITEKMLYEYFEENHKETKVISPKEEIHIFKGNIFELPTDCDEELHSRRYKEYVDSDYLEMFFKTFCLLIPWKMVHWHINSVVYNIDTDETMVTLKEYMA